MKLFFSPYKRTFIDKSKLFFTSDTHFYHTNILKYCNRPFSTVEDMNEAIINRWNSVIPKDGIVIHCGDFSFCTPKKTKEIIDRLNGTIILVCGNHDNKNNINLNGVCLFKYVESMINIVVNDSEANGGKQYITCCHYPMDSYYNSMYGAWMIYGHCHGTHEKDLDVGVDSHDFYPWSYNEVKEYMKKAE